MRHFVTPIRYLIIEKDISIFNIHIYKNGRDVMQKFIRSKFDLANLGGILLYEADTNPVASYRETKDGIYSDFTVQELTLSLFSKLSLIINCLWLVNDHSCHIYHCYTKCEEGIQLLLGTAFPTLSSGLVEPVQFTNEELISAEELVNKLDEGGVFDEIVIEKQVVADQTTLTSTDNFSVYSSFNRIRKGFEFLEKAKVSTFVPLKISFYVITFESLFSTNGSRASKKIAKRAGYILQNDSDQQDVFKDLISRAYDIRSKLLHGENVILTETEVQRDDFVKISKSLDHWLRKVFVIIINFHIHRFKNEEDTRLWFLEMDE